MLKANLSKLHGARGVLLQVFVDSCNDSVLGIEINPRFGGGYPISHAAGANYPSMLIREYLLNESLVYHEDWEEDLLALRHDSMFLQSNFIADELYEFFKVRSCF